MQHTTLLPGYKLQGTNYTYEIVRVLGQGTFGITYLAQTRVQMQGALGRLESTMQVAVKEFFMRDINGREGSTVTSGSEAQLFVDYGRKFENEAKHLSQLKHPGIVNVVESFRANNTIYFVMEHLPGGSLDSLIGEKGLPETEAVRYARQIAAALQHMHAHKMLHLDLKPGNIMLDKDGKAVLIDFGLSKQYDAQGAPESSTAVGAGTPGYAPLEQINYQDGKDFPVTMDIYAFGGTLFKMLTGQRPPAASEIFNDGFPTEMLEQHGVSPWLIRIVKKAMAPARRERYQNVEQLLADLGREKADESTVVESVPPIPVPEPTPIPTPTPQPTPTPKPKKSLIKWIVALVIICCAAGIAFYFMSKPSVTFAEELKNDGSISYTVNDVSFNMLPVEGASFQMGSDDSEAYDEEKPVHQVTLSSYYIGETEVTQELWEAVMGSNPSYYKGPQRPVETVSWNDCKTFISKLNRLTGKSFRLPTEAEWEFAAKGGNKSRGYKYSGSNNINDVAWYDDNSNNETHNVKSKVSNELGIYDMSGNVWEWCNDWYGDYSSSSQTNPQGSQSGQARVLRGGSIYNFARICRSTIRGINDPGSNNYLGLRLALSQ